MSGLERFLPLPAILILLCCQAPAQAQRVVTKLGMICPLGYVDMLNGRCSTLGLMHYTVQPKGGQPCPSDWIDVGGGYCRKT